MRSLKNQNKCFDGSHRLFVTPGPKLMTDTQHSTLHVFDWGFLSVEFESFHTSRLSIQIHGSDAEV